MMDARPLDTADSAEPTVEDLLPALQVALRRVVFIAEAADAHLDVYSGTVIDQRDMQAGFGAILAAGREAEEMLSSIVRLRAKRESAGAST